MNTKCLVMAGLFMLSAAGQSAVQAEVEIQRLDVDDSVYTPFYQVDTGRDNERPGVKKWIRFGVRYENKGGWIDELTIRYRAYAPKKNGDRSLLFESEVTYLNIDQGDHVGYVYLHPSYVERYELGAYDLDFAARIFAGSEGNKASTKPLAVKETTNHSEAGWSALPYEAAVGGTLLNRTQTPFWFIDYDNRELVKVAN